jgi:hypothetical protein
MKDATVPGELDPIAGADALMKELTADGHVKEAGTDTVNGIGQG